MEMNEKIKELRTEMNISQEKLAELLEVSRQAVAKWESGKALPDTKHLIKLSQIFNIPVEDITTVNPSNTYVIEGNEICSFCGKPAKFYHDKFLSEKYCSPKCQQLHEIALQKIKKNMKWFILGIVISSAMLLLCAFLSTPFDKKYLAGGGILLLGVTLILFPFCTPESYKRYGYEKTTKIGRFIGFLTELFGLFILIIG